jgi:predicted PurR-regulated permease PerM
MAMLEIAGKLVEPVDDEIKPLDSAAPEQVPTDANDVPVLPDIKAIFQGGIFLLMLLGACYAAAEVVLPIVLALVLMLVLQPAMRLLERWYLPRGLAALVLIVMLFGALIGLGTALSRPAANWA